ncbi:MAG: hypothetical protein M5U27_04290 [Gaiella sp.]|nr:hypothetical protein [Gaiella sp.]
MPTDDLALERFLVEVAPYPGGVPPDVLTLRARQAADAGGAVRYVRTIYVPEDGSAYLLFEARSAAEIERALRTVGLEAGSIASAIRVEPGRAVALLRVPADTDIDVNADLGGRDPARASLAVSRHATKREE